jgi:hypothetical protein
VFDGFGFIQHSAQVARVGDAGGLGDEARIVPAVNRSNDPFTKVLRSQRLEPADAPSSVLFVIGFLSVFQQKEFCVNSQVMTFSGLLRLLPTGI